MDRSLEMSAPTEEVLHGVRIHKLPVARYLRVVGLASGPLENILRAAFQGNSTEETVELLQSMDEGKMKELLLRAICAAPLEIAALLCDLLEIPRERLLEETENALTLTELAEVLLAFWQKNALSDFFGAGRKLLSRMAALKTADSGSKESSLSG